MQGHCVARSINLGTIGSRTFGRGHIILGRPVTPPSIIEFINIRIWACGYFQNIILLHVYLNLFIYFQAKECVFDYKKFSKSVNKENTLV